MSKGGERPLRLAMWSGPRNISTAMMRAFENRPDCQVVDEPFYASYLHATGIDHPMRDEVVASQPVDPAEVIKTLLAPLPEGVDVHYQKHMTQHMIEGVPLAWLDEVTNCFLIRNPREIVASYSQKRSTVTEEDIGIKRQLELFDYVRERTGKAPLVLEASAVLKDPRGQLSRLCQALEIPFFEAMLAWPTGRRQSDGVWAPHWYGAVEASTGFAPYKEKNPVLADELEALAAQAMPSYEKLKTHAL